MSWSITIRDVKKSEASAAIDEAQVERYGGPDNQPMDDQVRAAKQAAKALLDIVPGPMVLISINGHANGVGWHKSPQYANDCVGISVTQITEQDRPRQPS